MMGAFILSCRGKIFGGIYDDRLLVKPVETAISALSEAFFARPYEGAKELLLVGKVNRKDFQKDLCEARYDELPEPKTNTPHLAQSATNCGLTRTARCFTIKQKEYCT